jgi:hypothetical protein
MGFHDSNRDRINAVRPVGELPKPKKAAKKKAAAKVDDAPSTDDA